MSGCGYHRACRRRVSNAIPQSPGANKLSAALFARRPPLATELTRKRADSTALAAVHWQPAGEPAGAGGRAGHALRYAVDRGEAVLFEEVLGEG